MRPDRTNCRDALLGRLLAALIDGEQPGVGADDVPPGGWAGRVLCGEDGMVSWATVVAVVFLCFLGALVFNSGQTINQKIETQNAADSVAYSSTLWMARGMNAVTAANHMMGELTALYVLHHAVGGKRLDTEESRNNSGPIGPVNEIQKGLYESLRECPIQPQSPVSEQPYADQRSTVYDAKLRLKELMIQAYSAHWAGWIMTYFPYTAAAGWAVMEAASLEELEIRREYAFLDMFENSARKLKLAKRAIPTALDALWGYESGIVTQTPWTARAAADEVGRQNHCHGALSLQEMPLVQDPINDVGRCQLMRAEYPWVRWWRRPICYFLLGGAPLSQASDFYVYWSDEYSRGIVERFTKQQGEEVAWAPRHKLRLYIVRGLEENSVDKGREPWTKADQSHLVDDRFCLLGYARQPSPPGLFGRPFLRRENPDGVVCWAQAIFYNANYQTPRDEIDTGSRFQPWVGWDTLNWYSAGPNSQALEFHPASKRFGGSWFPIVIVLDRYEYEWSRPHPKIRLNWQAKLVPLTHHKVVRSVPSDPKIATYLVERVFYVPFTYYPHDLTTH
jgi:hypothetical protein